MPLIPILAGLLGCAGGVLTTAVVSRRQRTEWEHRFAVVQSEKADALEAERRISLHAQAQQRALFESMAEGVLVLDRSGRIIMANRSFREMLRVSGEIRGKTVLEAVRIPLLAKVVAQLPEKDSFRRAELEVPGSPLRFLEINASAVADENGGFQGAIVVLHDLTRLKQLESTRREFVANVSHELRTPLSLIKGFVETLLDGAADDPAQTERFLHTIQKHTNRLSYLIEDLLTISCLESGPVALNLEAIVLIELADRVIEDLRVKAVERRVRIENRLDPDLQAEGDIDRLQQVLANLVENAIKYGREGGQVILCGERVGPSQIRVCVQDDGPGIPPEAQARVFERFYRVDRARSRETGGTGLGLAIVKHIVQAHGGSVGVESELGAGSTFFFTLRCAAAAVVEPRAELAATCGHP